MPAFDGRGVSGRGAEAVRSGGGVGYTFADTGSDAAASRVRLRGRAA